MIQQWRYHNRCVAEADTPYTTSPLMETFQHRKMDFMARAALVAVFLAVNFAESRVQSPTLDEPWHVAAGLSYFVTHEIYRANPQHPPLLKG